MRFFRLRFTMVIVTLFCFFSGLPAFAENELRVVATIKPLHSILAGLMQGIEPPELLLTGEQTPFDYQPEQQQLDSLATAHLVVWVGPELETALVEPLGQLGPDTELITLLDNPELKLLDSRWDESRRDPFFWLDSRNGLILIDELTHALVGIDPGRSHVYKRNRNRLHERMSRLDRQLEYGYRGLKRGLALSYYDTQQYFEQAYALKIGDSLSEAPTSPVVAEDLLDARTRLVNGDYACLLLESSMSMPNLELLTAGVDIETGYLDSLGSGLDEGPDLYFKLMEYNTGEIKQCFQRAITDALAEPESEKAVAPEEMGGRFMLVDHNGQLFTNDDMKGKYQLIFFGYTSCPDICPTSMVVASQALKRIGSRADEIQTYFVSIDPQRDTPEKLNSYIGYFSDRIIGLTGSESMIARIAHSYNAKYERVVEENEQPGDFYIMDHTASFFLMSPDGRFITKFPYGTTSIQLAEKLEEYVR